MPQGSEAGTWRTCSGCNENKSLSDFYVYTSGTSEGKPRQPCKECFKRAATESATRRRREMGGDAWRARVAEYAFRSRVNAKKREPS